MYNHQKAPTRPFVLDPALSPATHLSGWLYATSRAGACMRTAPSRVCNSWYRETRLTATVQITTNLSSHQSLAKTVPECHISAKRLTQNKGFAVRTPKEQFHTIRHSGLRPATIRSSTTSHRSSQSQVRVKVVSQHGFGIWTLS